MIYPHLKSLPFCSIPKEGTPFYYEYKMLYDMKNKEFEPDSNKTFIQNMIDFQNEKKKFIAVEKILEIKKELFVQTGDII